jgi:hypothetical protein
MKTKTVFIIGLFVLLALGTVLLVSSEAKAAEPVNFENAVNGYNVQPMSTCTRVCSKCLPLGHNGACTTSGACC